MARARSYPIVDFKESQKLLATDPSRSQVVQVAGTSLLETTVENLKKSGDIVNSIDTLTEAIAADYLSGIYVLVGGGSVVLDGSQAIYRVSDPGSGGIVMNNGNELMLQFVANTPADLVTPIDSVENLAGFVGSVDGQRISLKGWHPDSDVGGGTLYWDSSKLKSTHNGGTIFSPTVPWTTTTADYLNAVGETDPSGSGCWVRLGGVVSLYSFAARTAFVETEGAWQAFIDYAVANQGYYEFGAGDFLIEGYAVQNLENTQIRGAGKGVTNFKLKSGENENGLHFVLFDNIIVSGFSVDQDGVSQSAGHGLRLFGGINSLFCEFEAFNTQGYGVGFQDGTFTDVHIKNAYVHDCDNDGIDIKDKNDDNSGLRFSNLVIKDWNLGGGGKAALDLRSQCIVDGVLCEITGTASDEVGVRYRNGEALDPNGPGAHNSVIDDLIIKNVQQGLIIEPDVRSTLTTNVQVSDVLAGIVFGAGSEKNKVTNFNVMTASGDGVTLEGDSNALTAGSIIDANRAVDITAGSEASCVSVDCFNSTSSDFRISVGVTNTRITACKGSISDSGTGTVTAANIP